MARLTLKQVESRIESLSKSDSFFEPGFIYLLLEAYGTPKSTVTRLSNGSLNVAQDPTREVARKKLV
nr:hypothetical protein [Corynebacterium glutamicum]